MRADRRCSTWGQTMFTPAAGETAIYTVKFDQGIILVSGHRTTVCHTCGGPNVQTSKRRSVREIEHKNIWDMRTGLVSRWWT
ncbi:unnamed protein product [Calypogeia fissa]